MADQSLSELGGVPQKRIPSLADLNNIQPDAPVSLNALAPMQRSPAAPPQALQDIAYGATVQPVADAFRALRGGMTDNEAQDFAMGAAMGVLPIGRGLRPATNAVKGAERSYETLLRRIPNEGDPAHNYQITSLQGDVLGSADILPEGSNLKVRWLGADADHFAPSQIRDVIGQLSTIYPEAKTISGARATGANSAAQREVTMRLRADNTNGQ